MNLIIKSVAPDLSAVTLRDSGQITAADYAHILIKHSRYSDGTESVLAQLTKDDANWTKLFSADGLPVTVSASDGVHIFHELLAKTQTGATIASGSLSFATQVSIIGVKAISLPGTPFTLYPLSGWQAVGAPNVTNGPVLLWTEDKNHVLFQVQAEQKLASDIRKIGALSPRAVKNLIPRYLNLMAAVMKFNCKDYKGAEWLTLNNDSVTENCGCS